MQPLEASPSLFCQLIGHFTFGLIHIDCICFFEFAASVNDDVMPAHFLLDLSKGNSATGIFIYSVEKITHFLFRQVRMDVVQKFVEFSVVELYVFAFQAEYFEHFVEIDVFWCDFEP